jgi:hypothetical protein
VSGSSGLFYVEESLTRVSQSGLKTGRDATMSDACGTIVEVVSEASLDERIDTMGCIGHCYTTFAVFNVLALGA